MNITKIKTAVVKIPVVRPYEASFGLIDSAENVILQIYTDDGLVGLGECCPIPGFSDEYSCAIKMLIDKYLSPALIGEDPFELEKISEKMEKTLKGNMLAKAGIDMALYDLIGKKLKVPVCKLLGGKYRETVAEPKLISTGELEADVEEARRAIREGYNIIKLKVGAKDPETDIKRIAMVREAVGYKVGLRVDANQKWSPTTAIRLIKKMEKYDLDYVEQPVPAWDIDGMRHVSEAVETPIMADESLFTLWDALLLVKSKAADYFNIKVPKHGGILWSKKIVAIAEAADIPFFSGALAGTSITIAASLHLISSTKLECLGISRLSLKDDVVIKPLEAKNGQFTTPSNPGLGVEINEEKLRKFTIT